ncbi:predicted protein [Sclerotinia sclerotiorum 1980 UF-70]|uniref:Uncharacterized protein n=1 Tax=Sclerotinia sclerotiorum (strain ATCC 18683 / 1980 / Ss-1) TaxID=665079 RepID=A7E527_SCLS1|nr:predicted protein [Sclerotinia sclerotiorum 1980 UF-70]EDN90999.1 predicted protein [Sclerotinia sclerotiorum 1980 UF-70]
MAFLLHHPPLISISIFSVYCGDVGGGMPSNHILDSCRLSCAERVLCKREREMTDVLESLLVTPLHYQVSSACWTRAHTSAMRYAVCVDGSSMYVMEYRLLTYHDF